MQVVELETERLLLRQWQDKDLPRIAEINADAEVMAYFPKTLNRDASDGMAAKCKQLIAEKGWGFWAAELKDSGALIGFVGLNEPSYFFPFSPCVEIGWRLHKSYWGNGYATEAATRALQFAFGDLAIEEAVAFTTIENQRSRRVMERLGMINSEANFKHPDLPPDHPLAEHVLYKLKAVNFSG